MDGNREDVLKLRSREKDLESEIEASREEAQKANDELSSLQIRIRELES